ncbi:MAG TPA: hypothetical protein VEK36_02055 [Candidatus Paceibacterota bacterium]|nr:hypothetical protein [Candidatus Paceibacterota bacterium]
MPLLSQNRLRRVGKILVIFLVLIGIVFPFSFNTPPAKADITVDTIKCLGGVTVGVVIQSAVSFVGSWVSRLLGGPTFVINVPEINMTYVLNVVERCFARAVLDNTIAAMLNTVRTKGRDGGVSWVRNWRNFQLNAEYRGENIFRTILANTKLCNYFQQDVRDVFGVTDKFKQSLQGQNIRSGDADPFTLKARCSLPDNFDVAKYQKDFAGNGGWNRLLQLARPENNFYGALLQSLEERDKQKAIEVAADINEATGTGYTGIRGDSAASSCLVKSPTGRCIFYANIKSPPGYVSDVTGATINAELNWVTEVHTYKELVVTALAQRLTNRLLSLGSSETDPTYDLDQVPHDIKPTPPPGYITPTPFPEPGPGPGSGSCTQEVPNGTPGPFNSDIAAAQNQIKANNPEIVNSDNQILNIDRYFSEMIRILQGKGYVVTRDGDQEINIYHSGATSSEQYAIRTSGGQTRNAWKATGCSLP